MGISTRDSLHRRCFIFSSDGIWDGKISIANDYQYLMIFRVLEQIIKTYNFIFVYKRKLTTFLLMNWDIEELFVSPLRGQPFAPSTARRLNARIWALIGCREPPPPSLRHRGARAACPACSRTSAPVISLEKRQTLATLCGMKYILKQSSFNFLIAPRLHFWKMGLFQSYQLVIETLSAAGLAVTIGRIGTWRLKSLIDYCHFDTFWLRSDKK